MYHEEVDFEYSDLLQLTRTYNSKGDTGKFGPKWSSTYETYIAPDGTSTNMKVVSPSGKWRYYLVSDIYGYLAYPGTDGVLLADIGGGYLERLKDGTQNSFNSSGQLTKMVSPTGQYITLDYSQANYIYVTDEFGRKVAIHLDSTGKIDQVVDPAGRTYTYAYDGNGDLSTLTFPDGSVKTYGYQTPDLLTSITLNGRTLAKWRYGTGSPSTEPNGYAVESSVDGVAEKVTLSYDTVNNTTTATDSLGRNTIYTWKDVLGIKKTTNVVGNCGCTTISADYGNAGNISSRTDKGGNITSFVGYDSMGNPGTVIEASNTPKPRTTRYTYNPVTSKPTSITTTSAIPFGSYSTATRSFTYTNNLLTMASSTGNTRDINGNPIAYGYTTRYSYNSHGQMKDATDPLNNKTTFGHYSTILDDPNNGKLQSITNPLGGVTTFGNYSSGKPGWMVSARNVTTNYIYDARGRLIAATCHDSLNTKTRTTRYGYDGFGNVTSALMPTGKRVSYEYDSANRLFKVRDGLGNYIKYTLDTEGNRTRVEVHDAYGALKQYSDMDYDENNRLARAFPDKAALPALYTGYTYNGFGNMSTVRDYNNHVTSYAYDPLNRLTGVTLPDPGDNFGVIPYVYENDINDNRTKYTDGKGNATNYVYDDMGRIVESTDAENRVTRYEYDAAGNIVKLRDPKGNVTTFEYNELGLVSRKIYADWTHVDYTYYNDGLVHTKKNARNITATYTYNDFGELESVSYSNGEPTVGYTYDMQYSRMSTATSEAGTWHYSEYDANGRVTTVVDPWGNVIHFVYDALGRPHTIQINDGEVADYEYDTQGRLSTVTEGTRVFTYTYTGANTVPDNLTRPNGSVTYYTYDNLYRLKDIANKNSSGVVINENTYAYNKAHMRTSETITNGEPMSLSSGTTTYSYNNVNQLTNTGYAYDADGNMTSWSANGIAYSASYDAENRLISVSYTGHTTTFTYGPDGLVAKQVIDGVETRFVRAGYLILQDRNASNEITRSYVWDGVSPGGIGGLLELTQGGAQYDYLYDGKGNVNALIDSNQTVAAAYRNDAFGRLVSKSGTLDQPYQFSTKRYYAGIGAHDYGYRFYLAMLGVWLTRDPIGEAGGVNLYGFVLNNAINILDLFGFEGEPTFGNYNTATNYEGNGDETNTYMLVSAGGMLLAAGAPLAPEVGAALADAYYLNMARLSAWPGTIIIYELLQGEAGVVGGPGGASNAVRGGKLCQIERHHLLPVKYRDYFAEAGLDIDDYIIPLEKGAHRLRDGNGIHTLNNDMGTRYEDMWKPFIEDLPKPTPADQGKILNYMNQLRRQYGI